MSIQPETDRENGMKDLIVEIVQALVDQPDQVTVAEIVGKHTNVLEPQMSVYV